ncbi:MAG: amidohydrolase, partial [Bacteroidota bacterium]|nr:amidohydrolase [Bacteroidota bacterium]
MIEEVKKLANHYFEDIVKIRRSMHQNPELSFEEYNTSLFIQNILQENKISFQSGIVKTGIVAEVKGELESSNHLVLRADMDALPIVEKNKIPYKSINEGVM